MRIRAHAASLLLCSIVAVAGSSEPNAGEFKVSADEALKKIASDTRTKFKLPGICIALLDGATEWQLDLGEGSWQIVDATEQILFALGTTENSSSPHSELLLCDGRSGDFVQRLRFPERIEFDDVHIGSGFVIVRAGNTLHGLAAREVQSPMQTTSFKVR